MKRMIQDKKEHARLLELALNPPKLTAEDFKSDRPFAYGPTYENTMMIPRIVDGELDE